MSFHPQTPQSPSQLSPSTSDLMTSMNSSMTASTTTTLPTPAHSVNGSSIPSDMAQDVIMEDTPKKRKRPTDDVGERDQKKVHIEDRRLGINNIHLDVGPKYLLCRTPHPPSRPSISQDLFAAYNLTGIAAEVARVLPNGEKNAIRKTYKGHIKKLGVQGHWDSVKEDWQRQDSLLNLAKFPDEEWGVHFLRGKDVRDGIPQHILSRLPRAATMSFGPIPKNAWDSSVLGDFNLNSRGDKNPSSARPTAPNTPLPSVATAGAPRPKTALTAAQEAARPKRSLKQRSYGDASYEGYGEGFPDDDVGGYSTGGDDERRKRRKKNHPVNSQPYAQARQPVYGLGVSGA